MQRWTLHYSLISRNFELLPQWRSPFAPKFKGQSQSKINKERIFRIENRAQTKEDAGEAAGAVLGVGGAEADLGQRRLLGQEEKDQEALRAVDLAGQEGQDRRRREERQKEEGEDEGGRERGRVSDASAGQGTILI